MGCASLREVDARCRPLWGNLPLARGLAEVILSELCAKDFWIQASGRTPQAMAALNLLSVPCVFFRSSFQAACFQKFMPIRSKPSELGHDLMSHRSFKFCAVNE